MVEYGQVSNVKRKVRVTVMTAVVGSGAWNRGEEIARVNGHKMKMDEPTGATCGMVLSGECEECGLRLEVHLSVFDGDAHLEGDVLSESCPPAAGYAERSRIAVLQREIAMTQVEITACERQKKSLVDSIQGKVLEILSLQDKLKCVDATEIEQKERE